MKLKVFLFAAGLFLSVNGSVFAHAVVKPNQAGVASFTDFTLGVPSEKPIGTTAIKLMIPTGLNFVSPIVKPGWKIDVKQTPDPSGAEDDDGNPAMIVSELDWTGGSVPAGQKDLFMFSAQVPAKEGELDWKVEQTYADGSTVSWTLGPNDLEPKDSTGKTDYSKFGPYSKTMVINDLTGSNADSSAAKTIALDDGESHENLLFVLSGLALVVSLVALGLHFRKRNTVVNP